MPVGDRLQGIVEIDESYVGGQEVGVQGRYTETKAIVAIAVEIVDEKRLGRVRLRCVPTRVDVKAVMGDVAWATVTDEFDVPYVVRYRVRPVR